MYTNNNSTNPDKLSTPNNKETFLNDFKLDKHEELDSSFHLNFNFDSSEKLEALELSSNHYSRNIIHQILGHNSMPSHSELMKIRISNLFTNTEKNYDLVRTGENKLKRKRGKYKRPRKENQDNIRRKIKRGFFNHALIKKLNEKLSSIKIKNYFEKFPKHFVDDVNRKRNKDILNLTLKEIFEKKELYLFKNNVSLNNYFHNLKIIQSEPIKESEEFKKIFNKTFRELYEEYLDSDEFKIDEINRLKEKNGDEYMSKYVALAENLIEFFIQ